MIKALAFFALLCAPVLGAESSWSWKRGKSDFKETLDYAWRAFYTQFTLKSNLDWAGLGVPATWYAFEHDERIKGRYGGGEIPNIIDHVGDAGVLLNFPFLSLGLYAGGIAGDNEHKVQFAKEYFAAMYLALLESGALSYVHVHARPSSENVSFWEREFRGKSSWPSGHTVPYATLFFKTLQFYGPKWAALPFALTVLASIQRIKDQKHWLSDVTASFFLCAFASEGVRAVAGYKKNHPFYRRLFERNVRIGLFRSRNAIGPLVSWNF